MLRHIDDSVNSWQRPGLRQRLVFALLGMLIALSYALLLDGEEAQAKGGKQSANGESVGGAIGGVTEPVREAAGEADKLVGNEEAGLKEVGGKESGAATANGPTPRADKPGVAGDGPARETDKLATIDQVANKATPAAEPILKTTPPVTNEATEPAAGQVLDKNAPPVAERPESLSKVVGMARDATGPAVEPVLDETISVASTALEKANKPPATEPILDGATTKLPKAEPIFEEASSAVEPVLEKTVKLEIQPVLDETTSEIEPVVQRATAASGPILEETNSSVKPILAETTSAVEPILEGASAPIESTLAETLPVIEPIPDKVLPAVAEPIGEAIEPVARLLGVAPPPTVEPVLEEAASLSEPAIGAAAPVFEPVSGTVAPVVGSGFGEGIGRESAGLSVLEGTVPASSSHALAIGTRGALSDLQTVPPVPANVQNSHHGLAKDEAPAPTVKFPGDYSGLSEGSAVIDGIHATLLDLAAAKEAREGAPRSFPLGFPPGTPPVGSSFGSSGAGVPLNLLAILTLLPVLSRVGGLLRSNRAAFKLGSSLRLAVERPG